jgi:hypothetical protein
MASLGLSSAQTSDFTGYSFPFTCVKKASKAEIYFGDSSSDFSAPSPDYQYICIGVLTTTASSTVSMTIRSSTPNTGAPPQLVGSIVLLVAADPDALRNSPEGEKLLDSCLLTLSRVVGMPASYISVWFEESRRLREASRQLSRSVLELGYSIAVPEDGDAGVSDIAAAEAELDSINVSTFESMLQENIDSSVGTGLLSVSVLTITADVVDTPGAPASASDDIQGAYTIVFISLGVGCCPVLALVCWSLLLRRRALNLPSVEADAPRHPTPRWRLPPERVKIPEAPKCLVFNLDADPN